MPRHSTHQKLFKKVDVGSMNSRILIQTRALTFSQNDNPNYTETFSNFIPTAKLWACMESVDGVTIFDDANIERSISHFFFTRYITGITFLTWISYENKYYKIYRVEDLQNEHKFYKIYAGITGLTTKPTDWA